MALNDSFEGKPQSPFANMSNSNFFPEYHRKTAASKPTIMSDTDVTREILNFLLPSKKSKTIVENASGQYALAPDYCFAGEMWDEETMTNFMTLGTNYRHHINALDSFVTNSDNYTFCPILQSFLDDIKMEITGLFSNTLVKPDVDNAKLRLACIERKVDKMYKFFAVFMEGRATEEEIWSKYLQTFILSPDLDEDLPAWRKLYTVLISQLLLYFDSLMKSRSLLSLSDRNCIPTKLEEADVRFKGLWSEDLYQNVVDSIRSASSIAQNGEKVPNERLFSGIFRGKLDELKRGTQIEEQSPNVITNLLEKTAEIYSQQYSAYIFTRCHEGNLLSDRLLDIKNLYSFTALCTAVNLFYENPTNSIGATEFLTELHKSVATQNILSKDAWKKWRVNIQSVQPQLIFKLEANLEWPFSTVFRQELLDALNAYLAIILKIASSLYTINWIYLHGDLGNIRHVDDVNRSKRNACAALARFAGHLYSVSLNRLRILLEQHSEEVLRASNFRELEDCVAKWTQRIQRLLSPRRNDGIYMYTIVDELWKLVFKFRHTADLTDNHIEKMSVRFCRLKDLLSATCE